MPRTTLSRVARERRKATNGNKTFSNKISRRRNGRFRAEGSGRSDSGHRAVLVEPDSPAELERALRDLRDAYKMPAPEREKLLARKSAAADYRKKRERPNQPSKATRRRIKEVEKRYGSR